MSTSDAPMKQCPECKGQGGWFEDRWNGDHYTEDSTCEVCEGTGEVPASCQCGGPAETHVGFGEWVCSPCKADIDADSVGQATRAEARALLAGVGL